MKTPALLLASLVLLTGCISAEERSIVVDISTLAPAAEGNQSQTGRLVIHRDRSFDGLLGAVFRPPVTVDGQNVGECAKREMLIVDLAPGVHTVSTRSESSNERVFEIEAGETAYVVCKYTIGMIVPNINLTFETAEEGITITEGMSVQ